MDPSLRVQKFSGWVPESLASGVYSWARNGGWLFDTDGDASGDAQGGQTLEVGVLGLASFGGVHSTPNFALYARSKSIVSARTPYPGRPNLFKLYIPENEVNTLVARWRCDGRTNQMTLYDSGPLSQHGVIEFGDGVHSGDELSISTSNFGAKVTATSPKLWPQSITIAAWVRRTARVTSASANVLSAANIIGNKGDTLTGWRVGSIKYDDGGTAMTGFGLQLGDGTEDTTNAIFATMTPDDFLDINDWVHIAVTTESNGKLFKNGIALTSGFASAKSTIKIGTPSTEHRYVYFGENMGIDIKDVRVYSSALSADKIKLLSSNMEPYGLSSSSDGIIDPTASLYINAVEAVDPEGDKIEYSVVEDAMASFEVTPLGIVALLPGVALDYETVGTTRIALSAKSGGSDARSTVEVEVVVVDVDEAPVCEPGKYVRVIEEQSPSISRIGAPLSVNDPEFLSGATTQLPTFSLASEPTWIAINESTGQLFVKESTSAPLYDENNPLVESFTFQATDYGGKITEACPVEVHVIRNNTAPVVRLPPSGRAPVSENAPLNSVVTTITASDSNINDVITFDFVDPSNVFAIDSTTGAVTVTNPGMLDFERSPTSFFLKIRASDNGTPSASGTAELEVR